MKMFEQYLFDEEILDNLRITAKEIVKRLATLPWKQGAELALEDNCRVIIKRISSLNNDIAFLEVEVYLDNMYIGNIQLDFKSESPNILVAYSMNNKKMLA